MLNDSTANTDVGSRGTTTMPCHLISAYISKEGQCQFHRKACDAL